jgi:2-succinyl-5-enolpyruvyl-6-hydroxy-3-cyclohexene-1-carboxylate synthase
VINNGGGRIFELLPIAQGTVERERFERAFATPQTLDIAHAAAAFAIRHRGVSSGADLESALAEALARGGCTVVEARVPPTGQLERRRRLITAVRAGLTEAAG